MAATEELIQKNNYTHNGENEVSRDEIKAALAKAVELRALHAALLQGTSPSKSNPGSGFPPISSPALHPPPHFSAQDYPIFTPGYEDDPLPGYQKIQLENQNFVDPWDSCSLGGGNGDETILSTYNRVKASSRKGRPSEILNLAPRTCPSEDQKSVTGSCADHSTILQTSPGTDFCKSRRNSLGDLKSVSSCNKCKPAVISRETDGNTKIGKNSNVVVPLTDSHSSVHTQAKSRGLNLSWLFPRLKKKNKNESSPNRTEPEDVSQVFKDLGIVSIETLKKELIEANESRDAAFVEVAVMKSSLGELKQKLEYLEAYCEELKMALRQVAKSRNSQVLEKLGNLPKRGKSIDGNGENVLPVSDEAIVEGFLQVTSEARSSVKHFCKTIIGQIEETDNTLLTNLNSLLQPYKLSLNSKYSKAVLYHLEAIINQSLYQDFENCVFQKNGSPKFLDPEQDRCAQFSSFVALRNLNWNEVLRKGTKYYSEEFSKFCDQKMSCIIGILNWTRPWPEQLLQAFFIAAKCIWLLHLLAFSFNPPLRILRVEDNRTFDPNYMEDMFIDRQISHVASGVKVMVMPGFFVQERLLRCKVICRYKSVA